MIDRILVPLDGSEAAEAALTMAELIPSRRVQLLAVESEVAELSAMCREPRDCHGYLERVAEPLRRQGRHVETFVEFGDPARQIVASAATADLLIMGSHGRGAMGRLLLGSVAEWVARHAPAPTMIVRGGQRPATTMPLTRIVVPLDGSPLAAAALPMAEALAGDLGLPIHLIRVVDFDMVRASVQAGIEAAKAAARLQTETIRRADDDLAAQLLALRNRDVIATSEVRTGAVVAELLASIREGDLVVLATRERGGIARWLLGSVATELVRHAAGPVLLVRAAPVEEMRKRGQDQLPASPPALTSAGLTGGSA